MHRAAGERDGDVRVDVDRRGLCREQQAGRSRRCWLPACRRRRSPSRATAGPARRRRRGRRSAPCRSSSPPSLGDVPLPVIFYRNQMCLGMFRTARLRSCCRHGRGCLRASVVVIAALAVADRLRRDRTGRRTVGIRGLRTGDRPRVDGVGPPPGLRVARCHDGPATVVPTTAPVTVAGDGRRPRRRRRREAVIGDPRGAEAMALIDVRHGAGRCPDGRSPSCRPESSSVGSRRWMSGASRSTSATATRRRRWRGSSPTSWATPSTSS